MKKNISINISGIIFHIEEDGYDTLRKYLDSINRYFSSFEDSSEILADIESRIAEIFLSKLNEGKQVITAEDVQALVTTMGSVSDFRAVEENQEFNSSKTDASRSDFNESDGTRTAAAAKPLMRDEQRKIIGGVCAGLGNYFNVDPMWIRLLFTVLAFAYGITVIVYLVIWVVVPGSYTLDEPQIEKKMFRDPERKVLGGVSGGFASYLGIDITIVRVIFVLLTLAGGLGAVVYTVLWIVLPEARTLTERMQMQGEPVTLSGIESTIKKNLNVDPDKEESTLTKILLFPFRVIAMLLSALAKILGPLVNVVRVVIGIMLILVGVAFALATITTGGVTLGLFSSAAFAFPWGLDADSIGLPLQAVMRGIPVWIVVAGFVAALVPALFIIQVGGAIISQRFVFGAAAWGMFVLFFVSVVVLSIGIPKIVYSFKEEGMYRVETAYNITGKRAVLQVREVGLDDYRESFLTLKGHAGKEFKLVQDFKAQGSTRQNAIENAKMVDYTVTVQDSVITFDSNITFHDDAIFRAQRLDMTLFIPFNHPFTMTEGVSRFITQYVDGRYLDGETWKLTAEDGLTCMTCPPEPQISEDEGAPTEVEVNGIFDVHIIHGDGYELKMSGEESEKAKYKIEQRGNTLVIDYEQRRHFSWDDFTNLSNLRIDITLPDLQRIQAAGAGKLHFDGFDADKFSVTFEGVVKGRGTVSTSDMSVRLSGVSQLDLSGQSETMNANVDGTSSLRAYQFDTKRARVEANGVSSAEVNVSDELDLHESGGSDIDYRGQPHTVNKE